MRTIAILSIAIVALAACGTDPQESIADDIGDIKDGFVDDGPTDADFCNEIIEGYNEGIIELSEYEWQNFDEYCTFLLEGIDNWDSFSQREIAEYCDSFWSMADADIYDMSRGEGASHDQAVAFIDTFYLGCVYGS